MFSPYMSKMITVLDELCAANILSSTELVRAFAPSDFVMPLMRGPETNDA